MDVAKVSVIVPVYNVEKYIKRCLESLICQDYTNIEIIVVDDGSTDRSASIVDELSKVDSKIKVIHQNNKGVSSARNAGIEYSEGEYIMFVDGDDWVEKDYVSYFLKLIQSSNCYIGMNRNNYYVEDFFIPGIDEVISAENAMVEIYKGTIGVAVWNKIYNADMLKKNNVYFENSIWYGEGMLFNIVALQLSDNIVVGTKPVYHQTFNPESAMRKFDLNSNYCGIRSLEIQKAMLRNASSKLNDAWEYHRYCFNRTILNGLIRTEQEDLHVMDIKACVRGLRRGVWVGVKNEKKIKGKLMWVCYALFPMMMAKRHKRKYNIFLARICN